MNKKKRILILNGPNLNLLGQREPNIYGAQTFNEYFKKLQFFFEKKAILTSQQSNHEGKLIDFLHEAQDNQDAIIFNAAAYTHSSIALRDAISAIRIPVIEVHISNVYAREEFRHKSYISAVCSGTISGFGLDSYKLAILSLI